MQRWQPKHGSFTSQIHYPFHEVSNANSKNGKQEGHDNRYPVPYEPILGKKNRQDLKKDKT